MEPFYKALGARGLLPAFGQWGTFLPAAQMLHGQRWRSYYWGKREQRWHHRLSSKQPTVGAKLPNVADPDINGNEKK